MEPVSIPPPEGRDAGGMSLDTAADAIEPAAVPPGTAGDTRRFQASL